MANLRRVRQLLRQIAQANGHYQLRQPPLDPWQLFKWRLAGLSGDQGQADALAQAIDPGILEEYKAAIARVKRERRERGEPGP